MRAVSMCFSVLHDPRCGVHCLLKGNAALRPLTRLWCENGLASTLRRNYSVTVLGANSKSQSQEGIPLKSWKQQRITRQANPGDVKVKGSKPCIGIPGELLDAVVTAGTKSEVKKSIIAEECISLKKKSKDGSYDVINFHEVQQKVESRGTQRPVTIIVFDTETTGLSRKDGRLVEIALRDLSGGENCTFQTLINPECDVPNAYIHGITTNMVRKPDVPRFKDLIPILREYVRSRQVPGAPVLLVAHNARCFDVPFLINEFNRCSEEIPSDWRFLDTLPLARELDKLEETKGLSGKSIKALREYYKIQLVGEAHRAMSDVHSLAMILREITIDLKLPVSSLLERSFKASDLANSKKKKNTN